MAFTHGHGKITIIRDPLLLIARLRLCGFAINGDCELMIRRVFFNVVKD